MAKTNFTKVEEALDVGLRRMTVDSLLHLADVSTKTGQNPSAKDQVREEDKAHAHLIAWLQRELKYLQKKDPDVYSKIGYKKRDIKKWLDNPNSLGPKDWESLTTVKEKADAYKKELFKTLPLPNNEQLVEEERVKHINKRFNVNEKWLPLK